ncbi:hypothetical protein O181_041385 [Austropuccinia psidii MF-1]|uniref:Uncharacterized protein n=1 Tax=Austropuccinia psidii MF-1 TaxID=1389203 RepID=A0A9Q3HH36_9BASI|nr:hypothetical protein [Austropuccinia psidii MF-1]
MDTKVGLGGKPKFSKNGPMILGDLELKKHLNIIDLMLTKTKIYRGFANKKIDLQYYILTCGFMIHRKILRQCGGDLEHAVKNGTTEQYSEEDILNILEEVTTRTRIGSSRVNLKTRFNTPWKDCMDKNPKENYNNIKYKFGDVMRQCHICQRTTHLANTSPKKGEINEIDGENEPDVEKDEVNEDN